MFDFRVRCNYDFKMINASVLIVEDEPVLLDRLDEIMSSRGCVVFRAMSTNEMMEKVNVLTNKINLIILDRMLGTDDSIKFLSEINSKRPECKILILSAIESSFEKAQAIELGADDYLAKPFDGLELIARVKSLFRRVEIAPLPELQIGNISIDQIHHSVSVSGQELNLSQKEFLLLYTLAKEPGKIFKKEELIQIIWKVSTENNTNIVESSVNSLRRKLEINQTSIKIKNTRFIGYWIEI